MGKLKAVHNWVVAHDGYKYLAVALASMGVTKYIC